ncbi:MAG: hypothetical protein GX298_00415 [Planctomycetes bacterium]|nr:hypothetical protein [Planctomycetota bacterium]
MKQRWVYSVILSFWIWTASGCVNEPSPVQPIVLEGIKLADIMPTVSEQPPPVTSFLMTTYLVDQQQVAALRVCMESFSTQAFRYKAIKAFESNGLFAAKGSGLQIHSLIECFRQQGVRQIGQGRLAMNPGYELPFGAVAISGSREITWVTADNLETKTFLANGTLCWLLKTQKDQYSPGRILASVEPVFTPWTVQQLLEMDDFALKMAHRFDAGRFEALLRESDFMVLGPRHDSIDEFTELERLLFVTPDARTKFRMYVIVCVDAELE